jgi:hypothetical protein
MRPFVFGYIRSLRSDLSWFVALPFVALAIALLFHSSLPYMAQASISVWITVPHHYAGWVRGYGLEEDWQRWKIRLIVGPALLIPTILFGSAFLPVTLAIVLMLWDHQHSMMQQYGFSRIYDFKANTGTPEINRLDFWLSVVLYGNLIVTGPLWSELWIAELYRWNLALRVETIQMIQNVSWVIMVFFLFAYSVRVLIGLSRGYTINPMKYLFLISSYGLWYYVSWRDSYLIFLVSHRIMHGVQYMLMVYWYVDNKAERTGQTPRMLSEWNPGSYILLGVAYLTAFHFAAGGSFSVFSFGLIEALQSDPILQFSAEKATGFYAATAISSAAACHYYLDSYIWKIRDPKIQEGL